MAKSGSVSITQGTKDNINNRTYITVTGVITTSGESYRGNHNTGVVTVTQNGAAIHSSTFTSGAPANSTTTLFTIELWVYHDDNGNSGTITASYNYASSWCSASTSVVLTQIPRYATITGAPNFTDDDSPVIQYNNQAGSLVTSLQACISLTGASDDIPYRDIPIDGSSYQFVLTEEEKNTLRYATPGPSRTVMFFVRTIMNGVTYYSTLTKTFSVSADAIPNVTVELSDAEGHLDKYGQYVQGKSKLNVLITAEGLYGATINSYRTTVDGKVFTGTQFTTDAISGINSLDIEIVVTDSRSASRTVNESIEVYEYTPPKILSAKAKRCQEHNVNEIGENHMGVVFASSVTPLGDKNNVIYEVYYKRIKDAEYETPLVLDYDNQYELSAGYAIFAADNNAYNIILKITDDFGSVEKKINGPSISVLISKLKYNLGIAFGKLAEIEGVLDIGFKTRFFGGILHKVLETESKADEVLTPNRYLVKAKYTYNGFPESEVEAVLDVVGDEEIIKQTFSVIDKKNPRSYERVYTYADETWSDWLCLCGDFIVEQGTSEDWYYRKWNSGIAECWRIIYYGTIDINVAWGAVYESGVMNPVYFPTGLFIERPTVCHVLPNFGSFYYFVECTQIEPTHTGQLWLWRPLATTVEHVQLSFHVIGKWK